MLRTSKAEARRMGDTHYLGGPCLQNPKHRNVRYTLSGNCVDCRCGTPEEKAARVQQKLERKITEQALSLDNVSDMWRGMRSSRRITREERQALHAWATKGTELLDLLLVLNAGRGAP